MVSRSSASRWIDSFIPGSLADNAGSLWRARLLVLTSWLGFAWGPFFAPVHYFLADSPRAALALVVAGGCAAGVPFLLRATANLALAGNILFAILYSIVIVVTAARGGFPVSGLVWSIAIPMLAIFLLNSRVAAGWLFMVALKYALLGGATLQGKGLEIQMSDQAQLVIDVLGLLTFLLLMASIAWAYEAERSRALAAAEAAGRAKTDFLARMSHEIRTPMNGVVGMTRMLSATELTERQAHYTETIRHSGTALLGILNEILDFSKIEAGKMELVEHSFEPREILQQIQALFSPGAEEKGLDLRVEVKESVPLSVVGDCGRLRQVLVNLVSNGVKFTDQGSIWIRSEAEPQAEGNLRLWISVEDTGIGIDPEALPTIFDPFTQVEESSTRRFEGTGLGLAICRQLIEMMGGSLEVTSQPGKGSRFNFSILVKMATPQAKGAVQAEKGNVFGPGRQTVGSGAHILVAEDNPINQEVTTFILETLGHSAKVVTDGQEALEALRQAPYDLVLMDCQMPVMDGYEATRRIRSDPELRHLPIVAMTANALAEDRNRCISIGMNDYVSKPVQGDELAQALSKWLAVEDPQDVSST